MVKAIVGANWGDEGKGKITDMLAEQSDVVIRFQGGANAGHTIINDYGRFALHILPSGTFYPHVTNIIGNGVALDIQKLVDELGSITSQGVPAPNLIVSERAQILMPYHRLQDSYEEERLGGKAFGSTKSGIAPFYSDKYAKIGIQVCDLFHEDRLRERLTAAVSLKNVLFEHLYHKPSLDVDELYQQLMELREQIRHSDCDAFIGATAANETANALGRTGILVYYGKESIRDACIRAGERARKLHENRQSREITNAILNNSQFGMIVTDTEGRVKLFNRTAQRFTGIAASQIRGKLLMDYFPNLSIAALLKSGQNRSDSYRLVVGAMMRCVQERITQDRRTIGTLITLYPESHNRKKTEQDTPSLARIVCRWEDVIAQSPIMKRTVEQGQNLAKLHYPTMILGQPGSGREIFARCMHSASPQAQKPCITIDLATIAPEDAPHILLGYEGQDGTVSGLLTAANGGSVILKNVALAKLVVHACLMQALTSRHIFRPGMTAPLLLDLMLNPGGARPFFHSPPPPAALQKTTFFAVHWGAPGGTTINPARGGEPGGG